MARENLSNTSLNALLAQSTGESFLVLLKITDGKGDPHLFTSDSVDTVIGAGPAPTDLSPPANNWDIATGGTGNWTDNLDNSFDYAALAAEGDSYILNNQADTNMTPGSTYDIYFTISSLVMATTFNLEVLLGVSGPNREIVPITADGQYMVTLPLEVDTMYFQAKQSTGDISCTITIDYIYPTGTDPNPPGGETYEPFPFDIRLPANIDGKTSVGQLVIDNISRNLIDEIRSYTTAMDVVITIVRGNDPTDIVATLPDLKWRSVQYDAQKISGELSNEDFLAEQFGSLMTGQNCPGLFFS